MSKTYEFQVKTGKGRKVAFREYYVEAKDMVAAVNRFAKLYPRYKKADITIWNVKNAPTIVK